MRVALMIEGQEDVTWGDWVALADACERSGVEALFRSDHYLSVGGTHSASLHDIGRQRVLRGELSLHGHARLRWAVRSRVARRQRRLPSPRELHRAHLPREGPGVPGAFGL